RSTLREDRLEDPSVEDSEAAPDGELSVASCDRIENAIAAPVRRIRETEAGIGVVARAVAVVDQVVALFRRTDILIARAEVQHEVVHRAPVVLDVEVLFGQTVLHIGRTKRLREAVDAAVPEGGDGGPVVHAWIGRASRGEAPESAVEVLGP